MSHEIELEKEPRAHTSKNQVLLGDSRAQLSSGLLLKDQEPSHLSETVRRLKVFMRTWTQEVFMSYLVSLDLSKM